MRRAESHEQIIPLIQLCKTGKVFDVQKWAAQGKPLDPPPAADKGRRKWSPLEYAIDSGCHSLVQVLVDGGADIESSDKYCALTHAVELRRFDLVQLLVEHGAAVSSVDIVLLRPKLDKRRTSVSMNRRKAESHGRAA